MVRSFLPVGQGAFYCECFEGNKRNIHVVYDCGSSTSVKYVEKEIKNNLQEDDIIDALFISHLDKDHVNGIPFLLSYCKVKKIYFPLISSANKKILKIYYSINSISGFVAEFLENPRRAIGSLDIGYYPELIQIDEAGTENMEQGSNGLDLPRRRSGDNISGDINIRGTSGGALYNEWLYIPFNFRQEDRIVKLMDALEKIYKRRITEDEVEKLWRNNASGDRDKIREAYKRVPDNFNTNSMTLFSGETHKRFRQFANTCYRKYCFGCLNYTPSGCLYTGDYDASGKYEWRQLENAYIDYWEHIGCVQIPHHGSRHGFNPDFLDMNAYFVISCGYANQYRHPHASVMRSFLLRFICPHIVTEHVGSAAFYVIR